MIKRNVKLKLNQWNVIHGRQLVCEDAAPNLETLIILLPAEKSLAWTTNVYTKRQDTHYINVCFRTATSEKIMISTLGHASSNHDSK